MGEFARLLPEHGWDVTVLTGRHSGSHALDHGAASAVADRATIVEAWSPSSAIVKRGAPVPKHGLMKFLRGAIRTAATSVLFPDREVLWAVPAIRAGQNAMRATRHDVVFATCGPPSNLLVGNRLAKKFGIPLVVDFRDLWSTLPMPVFPSRLHRAAAQKFEQTMVRSAARVIAVSPAMAAELSTTHGVSPQRAVSITNGFDPDHAALIHDERDGEVRPFRLMYVGSVHVHYNLEPFWSALRALLDAGTITPQTFRAEFVGNLSPGDPARFGVSDLVEISPFVPHDKVFDAFARADALFVVETPGYYARYSYAAKVFDYVLTGKPVVGLVEAGGYTERLLEAAHVGYCVDPSDSDGLARALVSVLAQKGKPARAVDPERAPLLEFNRRHLVTKLAAVLEDVTTETRGAT